MNVLTPSDILILMFLFGLTMLTTVWWRTRTEQHALGFLVADRCVPTWQAALSIAVSWIWAPAIFICSLQSFTNGVPGIFWFTAPNILCFFIFTPLAIRLRKLMPYGFTLPEFISRRYEGSRAAHLAFLCVFFGYQLGAIIINSLAGGSLLHALSGIDIRIAIVGMVIIALSYSLLSGLKASIFTDVIQMIMVLGITFIIVPWCIWQGGGWSFIEVGLGGFKNEHRSLFDSGLAFVMGIPMTLGLIAGPIGDQMFFQRAMAVKQKDIRNTFIYGGLAFGFVPIALSLLGFLAAGLVISGTFSVNNPQLVGAEVVAHLLPKVAVYAFVLMAFAGLCSTLDSSFCAISSLATVDIYKKYFNKDAQDQQLVKVARISMLLLATIGTSIALLQPKLLWVFLTYGALASAGLFPTIFSLYWNKLSARGAAFAVGTSLLIGTPLSIYANVTENTNLIVLASVLSVGLGLVICILDGLLNSKSKFDFGKLIETHKTLLTSVFIVFISTVLISNIAFADKGLPGGNQLPDHALNRRSIIVKFKNDLSSAQQRERVRAIFIKHGRGFALAYKVVPVIPEKLRSQTRARQSQAAREIFRFVRVELPDENRSEEALAALVADPETEKAYFAFNPAPVPAPRDIAPTTPNFVRRQYYTNPSPEGMDVKYARTQPGGRGTGIIIFDIEYGWITKHEDLNLNSSSYTHANLFPSYKDHGTAVAGILVGVKNKYGVRGIADQAAMFLTPAYDLAGNYNIPAAIYEAVERSIPGDVILLEQQLFGPDSATCVCGSGCTFYVPVEYDPATFTAIQYATAQGRVVVEAAGNGGVDLDSPVFAGAFNPSLYNSAAIMVGAVNSVTKAGHCYSNRGDRVTINSWGDSVFTTGYGDVFPPAGLPRSIASRQKYTESFSGTSSASALIAGISAAFEGFAAANGGVLTPAQVLGYFYSTGLASPSAGLGRMPDLRAAITSLRADRGL